MNLQESDLFVAWANTIDARIETSPGNVEAWHAALAFADPMEAHDAVIEHKRLNDTAPTPSGTRRMILSTRTIREATTRARAIEPPRPAPVTPLRASNPSRWADLIEQGRRERAAHLDAIGAAS